MGDALMTVAKEAVALPYEEQRELLNVLNASVLHSEQQTKKRSHKENLELVKSFMGVSNCWKGEDILEYQKNLRGEYNG